MDDAAFLEHTADTLARLPCVEAVTLGGSRAIGTHRPDSDWDLGIYYRADFSPQSLRDVGWEGEVSEIGGWGGGVFNGGAWLLVDGRKVDVHFRDLADVERQIARVRRGEFDIEPLMFHLAGIPTYLVVAELALNRTLRGRIPAIETYPAELRSSASRTWAQRAEITLTYAEENHARHGRTLQCLGLVAVAASQFAHAILARRGEWITNEKLLLVAAGLDAIVPGSVSLLDTIEQTRELARSGLRDR